LSNYPVTPLTPEQQQRLLGQVYSLLGKQVQSYHRHRHMGNNSSVPMELAQELLESINALGIGPQGFGGKTTALGVNIETAPTHIAQLPCAVNISCHVTRHKTAVL